MTRPTDARLLAFLMGELAPDEHAAMLDALEGSEELSAELRRVATGIEAAHAWRELSGSRATSPESAGETTPRTHRIPAWWVPLTAAAAIVITIPATLSVARAGGGGVDEMTPPGAMSSPAYAGQPESPDPSFVIALLGWWPDADSITREEAQRRGREYWAWTTSLAREGRLVAAGDLRLEPGAVLASSGDLVAPPSESVARPDFLVGMVAVRAGSYEEAEAIARACPHLAYGGSVAVRQVGTGFVTVPGMDDWSQ